MNRLFGLAASFQAYRLKQSTKSHQSLLFPWVLFSLSHGLLQPSNFAVVEGFNGEGEVVGAVLPVCASFASVKVEDKLQPEAGCRLPAQLVGPLPLPAKPQLPAPCLPVPLLASWSARTTIHSTLFSVV